MCCNVVVWVCSKHSKSDHHLQLIRCSLRWPHNHSFVFYLEFGNYLMLNISLFKIVKVIINSKWYSFNNLSTNQREFSVLFFLIMLPLLINVYNLFILHFKSENVHMRNVHSLYSHLMTNQGTKYLQIPSLLLFPKYILNISNYQFFYIKPKLYIYYLIVIITW